jgi:hypothetical protein
VTVSGGTVGAKRALSESSSDGDGEEKRGESDGSVTGEAPTPCSPQGAASKEEKRREKRRKRKARKRAEAGSATWLEDDVLDDVFNLSHGFGYSKYSGMYG